MSAKPPSVTASSHVQTVFVAVIAMLILSGVLFWHFQKMAQLNEQLTLARKQIAMLEERVRVMQENLLSLQADKIQLTSAADEKVTIEQTPELDQIVVTKEIPVVVETEPGSVTTEPVAVESVAEQVVEQPTIQHPVELVQEVEETSDFVKGKSSFSQLDYAGAIDYFRKVEKDDPEYLAARMNIANAYLYSQQNAEAVKELEAILKQQPDNVDAWIAIANGWQRLGEVKKEISAWDKVISLQPERWLHFNSRASSHYLAKNYDAAIRDYTAAAKLAEGNPGDQASVLENIGFIYLAQEDWRTALIHSELVNSVQPKRSWNALIRAIAALKLNEYEVSMTAFDDWLKYKRLTDAFIIEDFLPEKLAEFADVDAARVVKLTNPRLKHGVACVNNSQCEFLMCHPGAPDNKSSFCVAPEMDCAIKDARGAKRGEVILFGELSFRCYISAQGVPRWTEDGSSL